MIGIQSALIVAPLNIFIAILFRKSKSKNESGHSSNTKVPARKYAAVDNPEDPLEVQDETSQDRPLPHIFVYISWFLCVSSVLVSAAFTLFYSLSFGKEKAEQWLSSMLISFFQDVFISQPGKIVLVALIFALFYEFNDRKNNTKNEETSLETEKQRSILSLLLPGELEDFTRYLYYFF